MMNMFPVLLRVVMTGEAGSCCWQLVGPCSIPQMGLAGEAVGSVRSGAAGGGGHEGHGGMGDGECDRGHAVVMESAWMVPWSQWW